MSNHSSSECAIKVYYWWVDLELIGGKLKGSNGQIGLVGVSGNGVVNLQTVDNQLRLSAPDDVPRANISLSQQALIDVSLPQNTSIGVC